MLMVLALIYLKYFFLSQKKFDDVVMSKSCDAIVIFPIFGQLMFSLIVTFYKGIFAIFAKKTVNNKKKQ